MSIYELLNECRKKFGWTSKRIDTLTQEECEWVLKVLEYPVLKSVKFYDNQRIVVEYRLQEILKVSSLPSPDSK